MAQSQEGKVFVVTGANTGIGKVTALELAKLGGKVILACRSEARAQPVVEEIIQETGNSDVRFEQLDLGDLNSVKACAERILATENKIDVLINNAGLAGSSGLTQSGFELAFGVNHVGHFLLTELLLPRLKESAPSRIVNVASRAHTKSTGIDFDAVKEKTKTVTGLPEYQASKLANVLHANELARRLEGTGVTTYSLHPGVVASDVWREVPGLIRWIMKLFMISNEEGALTTLHCAISPEAGEESGLYYDKSRAIKPHPMALDESLAKELWDRSEEWVADFR